MDSGENVPRVAAAIDKMFENSDAPTKTLTEKQFQLQFMEMMGNVKFLINGISLIILFAVTLIVANTVAMSARERVTEIAVMRTLGFGRGHILGLHPVGVGPDVAARRRRSACCSRSTSSSRLLVAAGNKTSISIWLVNFRVVLGDAARSPSSFRSASASSPASCPRIRSSQLRIVDGLRQVV